MSRTVLTLVFAALLGLAGLPAARAGIMLTTNPANVTGPTTDYTTVGTQTLPFTDQFNRTVDGPFAGINTPPFFVGQGLVPTSSLTFSNLNPATTAVGFTWAIPPVNPQLLTSVSLNNGDSLTFSPSPPLSGFFGITDTTPFSEVTLNFSGGFTSFLTDFQAPAGVTSVVVPEPSTLTSVATGGLALVCAAAGMWRRRARRGAAGRDEATGLA
jgi:hypothetical protein